MKSFHPPDLSQVKRLVFDTETTGVDWKKDKVVGYVLCWGPRPDEVVYLPVRHLAGGNLPDGGVERWIRELLRRSDLHVINHSLKFDLHMGANHGIQVNGTLECTQVNEALIDENLGKYNLEDTAKRYPGVPEKRGDALYAFLASRFGGSADRKSQISNLCKAPGDQPLVRDYSCGDGTTTWHLAMAQGKSLDAEGLQTVWGVECRVIRTLFGMERRGVRIDQEALVLLRKKLEKMQREAEKALPKNFNVRSSPQIHELYKKNGVSVVPLTDKENPSFTEAWLNTNELGRKIVSVRKITNIINSFIDPILERHLHNGRVHTNFNQLKQDEYGVVTGRLSSDGPNLQQVPKRDKRFAPLFRRVFLPERGHKWSNDDYNQQEYRIFAEYLGSRILLDGYMADPPIDMHTNIAQMLKVERDPTAKRMNFGLINGMGVKKLAKSLDVSLNQALIWWNAYDRMVPEARKYLKAAEYWAKQRGWVRTKLHRRRRFPNPHFAHKAGNNIVQGTAADITKLKMVEIDEYFREMRAESCMLLQVHDELDWSMALDEDSIDAGARAIMCSFGEKDLIQLSVPMTVDWHHGKNWGEATFPDHEWGKDGLK